MSVADFIFIRYDDLLNAFTAEIHENTSLHVVIQKQPQEGFCKKRCP